MSLQQGLPKITPPSQSNSVTADDFNSEIFNDLKQYQRNLLK